MAVLFWKSSAYNGTNPIAETNTHSGTNPISEVNTHSGTNPETKVSAYDGVNPMTEDLYVRGYWTDSDGADFMDASGAKLVI